MIRVGPAGWSYPDSPGKLYPAGVPARFDALGFLASYFDTVEVNSTFYHPQPARTFASWVKRVGHNPEFRFTVKLWRRFTHERAAPWTADDLQQVTPGLELLAREGRLGALLAQFPWSFKPGADAAGWLERLAGDLAAWPVVVEVRHGDWGKPAQLERLRRLGTGFANLDQPVIGRSLPPTAHASGAVGYVRLHGRNYDQWFAEHEDAPPARSRPTASTTAQRYNYLYTAEELAPWIARIRAVERADGVTDVYVITNNHYEGKGPANALMIRAMLEGRKAKAPPVLFDSYRSILEPYAEPADLGADPSLF